MPTMTPTPTVTPTPTPTPNSGSPTIADFDPTSGAYGATVTITGSNFTGATAVRFNAASATFTVDLGTQIRAMVPAEATTGPIIVTTSAGTATSATNFVVSSESFVDTSVVDFSYGTSGTATTVSRIANGEVILAPTANEELGNGSARELVRHAVDHRRRGHRFRGVLTLDGIRGGTKATYAAGRSLEFVATFSGGAQQDAGFGGDLQHPAVGDVQCRLQRLSSPPRRTMDRVR